MLRGIHAADIPLEGYWFMNWEPGYAYKGLKIDRLGDTRFRVDFIHASHSGGTERSFEASWSGVALRETGDSTHDYVFYPVRVDGREALMEAWVLDDLEAKKRAAPDSWYHTILFMRSDEERFEWLRKLGELFGLERIDAECAPNRER